MATEKERQLLLEDYERTWTTWNGTKDAAHRAALGAEMAAIVRVSKILKIEPEWFAHARVGNLRYIRQAKKITNTQ
jgi:hypothetical protein